MSEQKFNCGCYSNKNYYNNEYNNYENEKNNGTKKDSCCIKRVEETFYCFPSYYNEEKEDKEVKKEKCFEGTFKICPNHNCDDKQFNKDAYNNDKNNHGEENEIKKEEQKGCKNQNRCCCFCGFNRFFRW